MTAKEIIESGLLELYALGQLSGDDLSMVEKAISQHPAVRTELQEIEKTLEKYAVAHAVEVSDDILDRTLQEIDARPPVPSAPSSGQPQTIWRWLGPVSTIAAGAGLLGMIYLSDQYSTMKAKMQDITQECEEMRENFEQQSSIYAALNDPRMRVLGVDPTDRYPQTELLIYTNEATGTNYLQIQNLPEISDDLAFQLWALEGDNAPRPLTLFIQGDDVIIPIDYVAGADAYAITIEQSSGAQTPNLAELIGVFPTG